MIIVDPQRLKATMIRTLLRRDVLNDAAECVVEGLLEASLRGVDSHGIQLFPLYIRELDAGRVNRRPRMAWHQTTPSAGLLNADAAFGHHAGCVAIEQAIAMAEQSGVAFVGVTESNHFGAAACFALRAAKRGLVGLAFTNTDPLMRAHGSVDAFCGTNPICLAAPIPGQEPFCLDMATTQVTWNAVGLARETGTPLAANVAFTECGLPTADPYDAAMLAPIGGHKGFGLGLCVEVLCGALTGGPFSSEITAMFGEATNDRRHIGHAFGAIDPKSFCGSEVFARRMTELRRQVHALTPGPDISKVLLPGEPEMDVRRHREIAGIPISGLRWQGFLSIDPEFTSAALGP